MRADQTQPQQCCLLLRARSEKADRSLQRGAASAAHPAEGSDVRTVAVKSTSAATATWRVPGKKKAHLQQHACL